MYKKPLSYALILSLIAPDIGRCMESDGPPIQRRQSLPSQLKKSSPETRKSRNRSFGVANRELIPLMPEFHRSVVFPQKLPLIEQKFEEQQRNYQDFSSPLNLTELVQECLIEPKDSGAVFQPLLQNGDPENSKIELKIALPEAKLEESPLEEKNEGDPSLSPPSDYTHSSPSSSPTKNSPTHSAETEESEATLTHSSPFDSPRDDSIAQKKDDKDLVPTLIDNKPQQEVMTVNSSQPHSSNSVLILPEEPLTQPSTDVHRSSQKVEEKTESSPTSMDPQKQSLPAINNDEMPNVSQQPSIIVITSETDSSESLSLTDASPRGQESISRRSSMGSSDSGSQQEMNTQGTSLAEATLLQELPSQEKPQRKLSVSSSGDETLQNLKGDKALLPKTLNSSQNFLEKQEQKQASESDNERPDFNFIGTWKKDYKKGEKPHLRVENIQDGGSREVDAELGKGSDIKDIRDANVPDEKTRLFPGKRRPLELSEKNSGLKEDWRKVSSDRDSLQFKNEHGDPDFADNDSKIGNQNGKAQQSSLGDGWVDLGSKGNSVKSYELRSFNGDGERPQPFCINGEPNDSQSEKRLAKNGGYTALDGDDPEGGDGSHIISLGEDDISPAMRAFLLHVNYLSEGKPSRRQIWMGGIGGTLIGVGVGNAMPSIFIASLLDLGPMYLDTITNNDLVAQLFISHTAITLGVDSLSRNVHILSELTAPYLEEFSIHRSRGIKWGRGALLVAVYTGAGVAALLPVYYLWDSQADHLKKHPEDKTRFLEFFGSLAPTLWLDLVFMISRPIKCWVDKKFNDICVNQVFEDLQNSAINAIRQQKLDQFKHLIAIFQNMDDEETQKAYTQLFHSEDYGKKLAAEYGQMGKLQTLKRAFSNQDTPEIVQIKINESQRILKVLHQIYKAYPNHSEPKEEDTKNEGPTVASLLSWGTPLLATPARGFILWYTIDSMLGSLGMPWTTERSLLSNIAGQIVASFFQGVVELETVSKALSNLDKLRRTLSDREKVNKILSDMLFPEDERTDHPCWKTCNILRRTLGESCKVLGATYLYVQGAWNTLPYLLVGAKATQFWPSWARGITLVPFGIADMFNNTISFQESYGGAYNFMRRLTYTYVLNPTPQFMRERLVAVVEDLYNLYQKPLQPDVVKSESILSGKSQVSEDLNSL